MYKLYKIFFINFLISGTLITVSAYSWLSMWIGLEINLLSFIPLMKSHNNIFPAEATLKYFITQALASAIVLFSILLTLNSSDFILSNWNLTYNLILNSALMTKIGAAPFHAWFPEVVEGLNWMNNLMLMTWQKIAPMIMIMYNYNSLFFSIIIVICSLISGILGLNQISLRKLMAYSSINHIAWMLASMLTYKMIWFIYFMIYSIILISIILLFNYLKIFYMKQLFMNLNSNKMLKLFFIFNFLSLGGLPPFLGFLPKWLVINNLVENNFYAVSLILIILTLITLFFYLRITFSTMTIMMNEIYSKSIKINNNWLIFFNAFTLMSLILCTEIFSML
uniref:NADH-ubiquinone oxidoreductase chain 2 n=1 Tax=Diabrotica virgifera virgifera TaxID=50390 RepID=V5KWA4_DIAVI|nr:NADH dehydrogenase subunit 2 [Diabrotica virgifera virgifera]